MLNVHQYQVDYTKPDHIIFSFWSKKHKTFSKGLFARIGKIPFLVSLEQFWSIRQSTVTITIFLSARWQFEHGWGITSKEGSVNTQSTVSYFCPVFSLTIWDWKGKTHNNTKKYNTKTLRLPGVEPGSIAWKAIILTVGLQTLWCLI